MCEREREEHTPSPPPSKEDEIAGKPFLFSERKREREKLS